MLIPGNSDWNRENVEHIKNRLARILRDPSTSAFEYSIAKAQFEFYSTCLSFEDEVTSHASKNPEGSN